MVDQFKSAFKEEAYELLNQLESALLEIEESPEDPELISAVFRTMHTIKGSAGMFGFERISKFTHEVETVFDLVREGTIRVTEDLIDLTLLARDHIRELLMQEEGDGKLGQDSLKLIERFKSLVEEGRASRREPQKIELKEHPEKRTEEHAHEEEQQTAGLVDHEVTYRIRFKPSKDIFFSGTNPLLLLEELRQMGEYSCIAGIDVPPLSELVPEQSYLYWEIILTTKYDTNAIRDVFIFVESFSEIAIDVIDELTDVFSDPSYKRIGEILMDRGIVLPSVLNKITGSHKKLGETLVENNIVSQTELKAALEEQEHVRKMRTQKQNEAFGSSIRVNSAKLDNLVDLVGELVTIQARLSQTSIRLGNAELISIAEQIERLISELRDNTMSMRMLPIGSTFSKFRRLVRDLSSELEKDIELVAEGAETELDKTVIEKLNDPLVHLIRNSIDHGIEMPDTRERAGKPRQGIITLRALHSGASVLIVIEDDGAGLNKEKIRARAIERKLISPNADLSDEELYQLIFAPGFSTADVVTKVSGRGVGMDVVKRQVDSLGGTVSISTELGKGTRITLKIPLTLAIIEGLLTQVNGEYFVLPLSAVEECVELTKEDRVRHNTKNIANVRGEILPYIRLRKMFGIEGELPDIEQIVVVNSHEVRIGFVVDQVIGDFQTVIKALGRVYKNVEGISGATILGDGSVALILDVHKLADNAIQEEHNTLRKGR